ncbi:hypothetical protein ABEW32_16195 [Paenibacillus jamilae]|uniref:hypothetical protein n=1 Tax=Paenibacillus jamilae TaxID=114136 RepID=UPI003D2C1754
MTDITEEQQKLFKEFQELNADRNMLILEQMTYNVLFDGLFATVRSRGEHLNQRTLAKIILELQDTVNTINRRLVLVELDKEIASSKLGDSLWILLEKADLI